MTNKDRQARYREKVKELGLKTLRVNISPECKTTIDAECKRTGETQAQVIGRSVGQLGRINQVVFELLMLIGQEKELIKSKPIFKKLLKEAAAYYMKHKHVIE